MSMRSLWTAATGMSAQQTNMDVIANNLANASTTGFKRSRGNFEDVMYQTIVAPGADTSSSTKIPTGIQIGMGTKTVSVEKLFQQGNFTETDNNLDLAIQGNGFFMVLHGSQDVYTRAGSFKTDQNGNVVDASGYHAAASNHNTANRRYDKHTSCRSFHGHGRHGKDGAEHADAPLQLPKSGRTSGHRSKLFHPDRFFRRLR